jgi:hypothetical protein
MPPLTRPVCSVLCGTAKRASRGVHALRRERRVRFASAHPAAQVALALVGHDRLHVGRLADDAARRADAAFREIGDQAVDAEEGRFLVVGQRQVDREPLLRGEEARRPRERDRDEPFHVRGAAAVDAAVAVRGLERLARPVLTVDRHGVGVARKHQPARLHPVRIGRQRGEQVGLAAARVVDQLRTDAEPLQFVARVLDQPEVGVATDRRKRDQPVDHGERVGRRRSGNGGVNWFVHGNTRGERGSCGPGAGSVGERPF